MHARIATFEGPPDRVDEAVAAVRSQIESQWDSPPQGMEGVKETWMLVDRKNGKGVGITVYETEADLRRGDAALNAMTRPGAADAGQRCPSSWISRRRGSPRRGRLPRRSRRERSPRP